MKTHIRLHYYDISIDFSMPQSKNDDVGIKSTTHFQHDFDEFQAYFHEKIESKYLNSFSEYVK